MILHLSNDLMLVGKVSSWTKAHGVLYKNASSFEKFRQILAVGEVNRVIVDLQFKALDIEDAACLVRSTDATLPLFGYAQHVMVDLIDRAKAAQFDEVLTRGQFDRGFGRLMG